MRTNSVYGVDPYYNPRALHFPQTMSGNYLDGKTSAEMGRLPSDHALGGSGDGGYYPHLGKRKWDSRSATERWALNDDYNGYGRRGYDGGYTTNPGYGRPIGYNDYDYYGQDRAYESRRTQGEARVARHREFGSGSYGLGFQPSDSFHDRGGYRPHYGKQIWDSRSASERSYMRGDDY